MKPKYGVLNADKIDPGYRILHEQPPIQPLEPPLGLEV